MSSVCFFSQALSITSTTVSLPPTSPTPREHHSSNPLAHLLSLLCLLSFCNTHTIQFSHELFQSSTFWPYTPTSNGGEKSLLRKTFMQIYSHPCPSPPAVPHPPHPTLDFSPCASSQQTTSSSAGFHFISCLLFSFHTHPFLLAQLWLIFSLPSLTFIPTVSLFAGTQCLRCF